MQDASSLNYEELLNPAGHRGRGVIIGAIVAALVLAGAGYLVWAMFFSGGSTATAQTQTATVTRGSITKTVSTSGTVAADQTSNLNFSTSGRVTKVDVTLGQAVKQGDVLAEIDPTDAQSALQSAQSSLASAQSKLDELLQGSTASELAAADESVTQAQASYDKAVRTLNDLQAPAAATDVESAQQDVVAAQAKLQSAKDARAKIDSDGQDAVAAAQEGVDKAQAALTAAEQAQSNADATVASSQGALYSSESAFCPVSGVSFCSGHEAPISSGDQATLVGLTNSGTADQAKAASAVLSANSGYTKAITDDETAANGVAAAQGALGDANAALDKANAGPTQGDIETADAAIGSAQAALDASQDKLNTLQSGPTADDLGAAQSDVDTAGAALTAAEAKRDETYAGSTAADIQQQRQAVNLQQTAVDKAQKDVDDTKLTAPFDGTVAALNLQVGDLAGSSSGSGTGGSSSSGAIVLNTPDNVIINLTISETDFGSVKVGQSGIATFDAIPGRNFPMMIDAIGTNPTTTQGVVTYSAKAHLLAGGAGFPGGGAGPAAAAGPQASVTPGVDVSPSSGTPAAGATPDATPGAGSGRRRGAPGAAGTPPADATPSAEGTPAPGATSGGSGPRSFGGNAGGAPGTDAGAASAAKPIPGMNAKITIITDQRQNVLRVPTSALQRAGANETLQVKQANGGVETVTVQTGLADATNTEITSGVDEGATVVIPDRTATASTGTGTAGATEAGDAGAGGRFFFGGGGGGGAGAGGRGGGGGGAGGGGGR